MDTITTTPAKLSAAFAEWERRFREEPARFACEAEQAAIACETLADARTAYILSILAEQAA